MRLTLAKLTIALGNLVLRFASSILFDNRNRGQVQTVCVYRPGNIGDIVCAVPVLKAIRKAFPSAKLILLSSPTRMEWPGASEILGQAKWIDEIWSYPSNVLQNTKGRSGFRNQMKQRKVDLWVELAVDQATFTMMVKHMIWIRCTGIRKAIGFCIDYAKPFAKTLTLYQKVETETERLLELLKRYGIPSVSPAFELPISETDQNLVSGLTQHAFPGEHPVVVAFNPGAKRSSNRWPAERYRELAARLAKDHGVFVAVLGSESEKQLAMSILNPSLPSIVCFAGDLTVLQTAALLKHCRVLVSNDTGTVHLAAAVEIPVVGLYSPWQRQGRWFPYGNSHQVIRKRLQPSRWPIQADDPPVYMEAITVEEAYQKVISYL